LFISGFPNFFWFHVLGLGLAKGRQSPSRGTAQCGDFTKFHLSPAISTNDFYGFLMAIYENIIGEDWIYVTYVYCKLL
jgi:hypothetical protein